MQMTWQTNFLIASSKPSTLVTRSACAETQFINHADFLQVDVSSVLPERGSAARRP